MKIINPITKYWLMAIPILLSCYVNAQTADFTFTGSDSFHCAPYSINFSQACSDNPEGFIWNFGNGQRSSSPSETITYNASGVYHVTLTAIYTNGAVSKTKTVTINPTPVISLSANTNYLCKPGVVSFTATGSSFISGYEWNFGDGGDTVPSVLNTASYNYSNYGNYRATVKAVTASGCHAKSDYAIRVNKFGITASLSINSGCVPASPVFTVTTQLPPGDAAENFEWNFGDGSPLANSEVGSIIHTYNSTQRISTARVMINSQQGCSNQYNFPEFAYGTPPFNTNVKTTITKDSFCASETIRFYGKATNANVYKWQLGDNNEITTSDTIVTHKYRQLGNRRILITPYFNGCKGIQDSTSVFIKGVISEFLYGNSCSSKNAYYFTNRSIGNITRFLWEFTGNPESKDSAHFNTSHSYPVSGTYKATLSLSDSVSGCTDKTSYPIYTAVPKLTSSTNSVCKDSLVIYNSINTYPAESGFTYYFNVNGNTINNGTDSILNYHPANHGSFAEYVVINDANPRTCNDTIQLSSSTIVKGPVVSFTTTAVQCVDIPFSFTNNSHPFFATDSITTWRWSFGDNTQDSVQNPQQHLYTRPSGFTIVLTATDVNGCSQKLQQNILAAPLPKIIAFPVMDTICQARDTAVLTGYTIDSLLWLPSTNISCNYCDTTMVYPMTTTSYIARAKNRFGCISYDTSVIKVFGPLQLTVYPNDTSVCLGQTVTYNLNTGGIISWSPASSISNPGIKNPVAKPASDVIYTVVVKDSAGCYSDTASAKVQVFQLPTVNAGPDKIHPYNTAFSIMPDYSPNVVAYQWEPANYLNCSNCASPSGIALQSTTYTIKTLSAEGCRSSDNISIFIACENGNLLLPTAFSPNGNGINENFYPITRGYKNIKAFMIFNRRGNKVFERKNFAPNIPSLGWDGIIKNSQNVADTETYAWYIEAECEQGQLVTNKGTVVLIR